MSRNSFKELEQLEIEKLDARIDGIKKDVNHSIGIFSFAGEIAQLFIPRIFQFFISALGGNDNRNADPQSKYPNLRG